MKNLIPYFEKFKMRLSIIVLVTVFFNLGISAQSFEKNYGDTISNAGRYLLQSPDSDYYLLCYFEDNYSQQRDFCILRTNQYGDSLGMTTIPMELLNYRRVCTNSRESFVITTVFDSVISQSQFLYLDTLYITKVNTSGAIISQWKYADTLSLSDAAILETSDGGYLVAAGVWNFPTLSNVLLLRVDSSGTLLWKKIVLPYTSSGQFVLDMIETDDHNFIVEVEQYSGSNWMGNKIMLKVDPAGTILWNTELTYGYPGSSVHQLVATDTGYLYLDNIGYSMSSPYASRISLVDTGGALQWSKTFPQTDPYYGQFIKDDQNNFYLYAKIYQQPQGDVLITRLDQQLDSVSSFIYGVNSSDETGNYFTQLDDGGFALLGYSMPGPLIQSQDVYFLVIDSGFASGMPAFPGSAENGFLFPNPTTGKFEIRNEIIKGLESIDVFDSYGRKVFSEKESVIDISNHPSGIYLVRIVSHYGIECMKLVKE